MAIIRRRSPAERFEDVYGATWQRVRNVPMIRALTNPRFVNWVDTSPDNFSKMLDSFSSPRWISEVPNDIKIFFYALELVCHRAGLPGFLPEDFTPQLRKHMSTLTMEERIDKFENVSFNFRQCFLWDIPAFLARYIKPGSYHVPTAEKPAKSAGFKPKPRPRPASNAATVKPPPRHLRKRR